MEISKLIKDLNGELTADQLMKVCLVLAEQLDESDLDDDSKLCIYKCIYTLVNGKHYNKDLAEEQIKKFWYIDANGKERKAPYWTFEQAEDLYNEKRVKGYNVYDFWVTLNMVKSDYDNLLHKWLDNDNGSATIEDSYYVQLAENWLNDDDNPFGDSKIWGYFNSKE